ncbi:MAG: hydrogenase maturation nickel metallochaperone HypA [Bacillota bacterium]|jgi:hydrogenase nickel incorporation protein HypA/HybF
MHETSLMEQLLTVAEEHLASYRVKKVNKLIIKTGKLANVIPAALEFAFEALSRGRIMQGAELSLLEMPIIARCQDCCNEYEAAIPFVCPACGSNSAEIVSGAEVFLDSIDFEEEL